MSSLRDEEVLIVDCQTTGSSPSSGQVLELGWGKFRASDSVETLQETSSHRLIRTGDGTVPYRIHELTGISDEDLNEAGSPETVWSAFRESLQSVDHLVAHYAQFEARFLEDMAESFGGPNDLVERIVCSHELARHLLDGLPRKGIRAVAGYWGHFLPEEKRTGHHVPATGLIWKKLTKQIKTEHDVDTIHGLKEWLQRTDPDQSGEYTYLIDRDRRLSLPDQPGIYRMLDRNENVLYVGKSTSLKSRVNSYFQSGSSLSNSKLELVSQVNDVEVEPTETPLEASLLEVDQIKEHQPPYNSDLLRGERSVRYVSEDLMKWSESPASSSYLGPFSSRSVINRLRTVRDWLKNPDDPTSPNDRRLRELFEADAFAGALSNLREDFLLNTKSIDLNRLERIGLELWERDTDDNNDDEEDADQESEFPLTGDQIRERLEETIKWGTRAIRKGRWFRFLRSAELFWKPHRDETASWWFLDLNQGQVRNLDTSNEPELSENGSSADHPRTPLPIDAFDRLRVLTTELKRLTAENKPVRVSGTGRDRFMNGRELESVLNTI